jgi:hypothetical protein
MAVAVRGVRNSGDRAVLLDSPLVPSFASIWRGLVAAITAAITAAPTLDALRIRGWPNERARTAPPLSDATVVTVPAPVSDPTDARVLHRLEVYVGLYLPPRRAARGPDGADRSPTSLAAARRLNELAGLR